MTRRGVQGYKWVPLYFGLKATGIYQEQRTYQEALRGCRTRI